MNDWGALDLVDNDVERVVVVGAVVEVAADDIVGSGDGDGVGVGVVVAAVAVVVVDLVAVLLESKTDGVRVLENENDSIHCGGRCVDLDNNLAVL